MLYYYTLLGSAMYQHAPKRVCECLRILQCVLYIHWITTCLGLLLDSTQARPMCLGGPATWQHHVSRRSIALVWVPQNTAMRPSLVGYSRSKNSVWDCLLRFARVHRMPWLLAAPFRLPPACMCAHNICVCMYVYVHVYAICICAWSTAMCTFSLHIYWYVWIAWNHGL